MKNIKASEIVLPIDALEWEDGPFAALPEDQYEGLKESIKRRGIISPIVVRREEKGKYWVIDGRNRIRACMEVGLSEIPARVLDVTREEAELLTYHAELYRRHLKEGEMEAFLAQLRRLESDVRKRYRKVLRELVGLDNEENLALLEDEEIDEIMELVASLEEKAPVLVEAIKEKIKQMAEAKAARESTAAEIEKLKRELQEREAASDVLEANYQKLLEEKQRLEKEKQELSQKIQQIEKNIEVKVRETATQLALQKNQELQKQIQKQLQKMQEEKAKVEAEIRKIRESYSKQIRTLQDQLQAAKETEKRYKEKEKYHLNEIENLRTTLESLKKFLKNVATGEAVLVEFQLIQTCLDGVRNFFLLLQEEGGEALLSPDERLRLYQRWNDLTNYFGEIDSLVQKTINPASGTHPTDTAQSQLSV